jgi:DNA segregation ATPase FtsK/SpoIIIE, S-DNA-T family
MLYAPNGGAVIRVHGPFVADTEVESIAESLRGQGEPDYVQGIFDDAGPGVDAPRSQQSRADGSDDLYDRAVALVMRDQKASTSYIQRRLAIGYNRAADLIERMEAEGLVSPPSPTGKRDILSGPSH